MQGTYLIGAFLIASLLLFPTETLTTLAAVGLKIQIFYINYRMKLMAWRMHRSLTKLCKEAGWPSPGEFKFVDIWDRKPLD